MAKLSTNLYISDLSEWYTVSKSLIRAFTGNHLLNKYDSVEGLVRAFYPTHDWVSGKFKVTKSAERNLYRMVCALFPNEKVVQGAYISGMLSENGKPFQIDVHIPALNIGFEYQDPHHYFTTPRFTNTTLNEYQRRDSIKNEQARQADMTLVRVPFWWDWDINNLIATIRLQRPDLLSTMQTTADVFSETPPEHVQRTMDHNIPGLGAAILAMEVPKTQTFDPTGWFAFEKIDGMRAIWNPIERQLYSRWGSKISLPGYIADTFPSVWLDGEITCGDRVEGRYRAAHLVEADPTTADYINFKFTVFDSPNPSNKTERYWKRYERASAIASGNAHIEVSQYEICTGRDFVENKFFKIKASGGEGVILRDPNGIYEGGYSRSFYKYKDKLDAEALVIKNLGDGTYLCLVNTLQLKHNNNQQVSRGTEIHVKMSLDKEIFADRVDNIQEGVTFVSFKYSGLYGKGTGDPINPKIYMIRPEITSWIQILADKSKPAAASTRQIWRKPKNNSWTTKESRVKYFNDLAKENKFDPLDPNNWYRVASCNLFSKGENMIDLYYQGSYANALMDVYPQLDWNRAEFRVAPRRYWDSVENQRKFFDTFATIKGFNPQVDECWYGVTRRDITNVKGGTALIKRYGKSHITALRAVYPELNLAPERFIGNISVWGDKEKRRDHMLEYARKHRFNPHIAENWLAVTRPDFVKETGSFGMLEYHNRSLKQAIVDLLPELGLKLDENKNISYMSNMALQ